MMSNLVGLEKSDFGTLRQYIRMRLGTKEWALLYIRLALHHDMASGLDRLRVTCGGKVVFAKSYYKPTMRQVIEDFERTEMFTKLLLVLPPHSPFEPDDNPAECPF